MGQGVLLAATTLLCVGALELSFRLFMPVPELDDGTPPERSHTLRYSESPVSRHALVAAPLEVDVGWGNHYRVNSKGYRGDEFEWSKPPDTARVIVYGGSSVFDIYQDEGEDWPARVEELLQAEGAAVQVINAGVPGLATLDSVGRLLAEGHRLEPDFVVLYQGWNDYAYFGGASPVLRQVRPLRARESIWRAQGRLDEAFAAHSHLYRLLRIRFLVWDRHLGAEGRRVRGPLPDAVEPSQVEQFELAVATFVDLVRNMGAVPVLVTQPLLAGPDNTEEEIALIRYDFVGLQHEALLEAHARADHAIRAVARVKGAALVEASAPLSGLREYFEDSVHLSSEGSQAVAELVSRELSRLMAGSPPSAASVARNDRS